MSWPNVGKLAWLNEMKPLQMTRTSGIAGTTILTLVALTLALPSLALTVRTKSDSRLWETVTVRARPLAWSWEDGADTALLTYSNRLTRVVRTVTVPRTSGALRGECHHPVSETTDEALVAATLVQTADGVEVARETAELAYVPGVSAGPVAAPITVHTKAARDWWRVRRPRLAAFDARWWDATGPSGYEVLWAEPPGWHAITRAFEGVGVVDEAVLKFGLSGFLLICR